MASLPRRSRILFAALAVLFAVFWLWYGGSGDPLTPAEVEAYMARLEAIAAKSAHSDAELHKGFRALLSADDGREYYMLNLMKYREKALYPPGYDYDDDVQAAANRYNAAVVPGLLERGSLPILLGRQVGTFLGFPGAERWDDVGIVRYRSRRDMIEFAIELGEKDQGIHKWASIEKTQVFPVQPVFDFVFVRAAVAVLLIVVGLALHLLMSLGSPDEQPPGV